MTEQKILELFSKNLKRMIEEDNIKQEYLAYELGISQSMVSRYIKGKSLPSLYILIKLSEVLFCSLDDFLREN